MVANILPLSWQPATYHGCRQNVFSVIAGNAPFNHDYETLQDTPRGFLFVNPDRAKDFEAMAGCHLINGQIAENREGVGFKRRDPLVAVFTIAP